MGKVVVLKDPRTKDWNIYALREAAKLKKWYIGTFYHPRLKRLLVVFKPTPGTHINHLVFEELDESELREAYRMVCPEGCSRCCVAKSGAFLLDVEYQQLPQEIQLMLDQQPSEVVATPGGPVKVYYLGTGPGGRCIFFDIMRGKCTLEVKYGKEYKPIICLIHYCTLFAERDGVKYLKTGYRVTRDGKVAMFYRRVSDEEWKAAVRKMASLWHRLRRAEIRRRQEEKLQQAGLRPI